MQVFVSSRYMPGLFEGSPLFDHPLRMPDQTLTPERAKILFEVTHRPAVGGIARPLDVLRNRVEDDKNVHIGVGQAGRDGKSKGSVGCGSRPGREGVHGLMLTPGGPLKEASYRSLINKLVAAEQFCGRRLTGLPGRRSARSRRGRRSVWVSAVVGPSVKRLSRSRLVRDVDHGADRRGEQIGVLAHLGASLVAALKMRVTSGTGWSCGRHPARTRSSRCLTSVWSAMTLPVVVEVDEVVRVQAVAAVDVDSSALTIAQREDDARGAGPSRGRRARRRAGPSAAVARSPYCLDVARAGPCGSR